MGDRFIHTPMSSSLGATYNLSPFSVTPMDVVDEILGYLVNDSSSLYCLALCSRIWFRCTLPIVYRRCTTLALTTLGSQESLTRKMLSMHPANFVRQLRIDTEDDECLVREHFRNAMVNIETYAKKALTHFIYISDDLSLRNVWDEYTPEGFCIENIALNCPLQAEMSQVVRPIYHCIKHAPG